MHKNIKWADKEIKGLSHNKLNELTAQTLTRIENGKQTIGTNACYKGRSKGGLKNKETGHIQSIGKEWGQFCGKTYGKKNGKKVAATGLGAKAMKDKYSAPIKQFDMNGKLVAEWDSINDAKRSKHKFHAGHISTCCNGLKPQYRGFIWKFKK